MLIVFAAPYDPHAAALVARWSAHDAALLTSRDLSSEGWAQYSSHRPSTIVIGGRRIDADRIRGVLIRWPGIFPQELTHIAAADRDYVATEMMAFMVWWLSTLRCPVINQPTPLSLTGPAWRPEQWVWAAHRAGIPVVTARRQLRSQAFEEARSVPSPSATVTVVGDRCFGAPDDALRASAQRLATEARVQILEVSFDGTSGGARFAGANLLPEWTDEISEAALALLVPAVAAGG